MSPSSLQPDTIQVRQMLDRIRAHRLARDWSQAEMARRAGLSKATYQAFESGFGNPTLANLLRVLGILGLSHRLAELVPAPEERQTLESVHAMAGMTKTRATARPRLKEGSR